MPTLTIRKLSEEVYEHLRIQAAKSGRSMEGEARHILCQDMKRKRCKPGVIARQIQERFARIGGADKLIVPDRSALPDAPDVSE